MNPIAMMIPAMETAKMEALDGQTHQLNAENKGSSHFAKLLHGHGNSQQIQHESKFNEINQPVSAEEVKEDLAKLEIKELEDIIRMLMSQQSLSEEDYSLLKKIAYELEELQQNGTETTQEVTDLSPIIDEIVHMSSADLLKDIIADYKQSKSQDFIARILPIGEIRIIERINEDGKIELKPVDPTDERRMKLQPINPINDFSKIHLEAKQVLKQVESLLNNIRSTEDISAVAPKVLELLQQWQKLVVQAGPNADKLTNLNLESRQLSNIWQKVVGAYQNRIGIQAQNFYNLDAKVTTHDIVRWLSNAMEATVQTEKPVQSLPVTGTTMPISKVEQFVIHLNQPQQTQPASKQLVEQFQKLMDTNRVTNLQNGRGQLAITLKPHNLGEMLVRFTQVNGEMMVKILVTTESAKKMLEGNMQQLRSMFSPHQVIIDKQEAVLTENQESQQQQDRDEQQATRDDAQTNQQKQQSENESFSTMFEELIVNEEV